MKRYTDLSWRELRATAKAAGLSAAGTRDAIVARLKAGNGSVRAADNGKAAPRRKPGARVVSKGETASRAATDYRESLLSRSRERLAAAEGILPYLAVAAAGSNPRNLPRELRSELRRTLDRSATAERILRRNSQVLTARQYQRAVSAARAWYRASIAGDGDALALAERRLASTKLA